MGKVLSLIVIVANLIYAQVASAYPEDFSDLVEPLLPAVVNISTTQKLNIGKDLPNSPYNGLLDDFLNEFFERFGHGMPERDGKRKERKAISLGSGFIVDPSGFIVTNHHVINEAEEIVVTLSDEREFKAKLIGSDTRTDIAVLKIEAKKDLPYVKFGDSGKVRVGEWVIAVGNPFGLGGTVTAGIISATGRDINLEHLDDFLQTDAAINQGNSGGPIFNKKGEVVGVSNVIISSTGGGNIGIGFGIPSNTAKSVVDQLRKNGKVKRGMIGVIIQPMTDEFAESLGLESGKGAIVVSTAKDGPAEKAGIQAGDIILNFNGIDINNARMLSKTVSDTPIGTKADIIVLRKDKQKKLRIVVAELNEDKFKGGQDLDEGDTSSGKEVSGVLVTAITSEVKAKYDIEEDKGGLLVLGVNKNNTNALKSGLRRGDIIYSVNQEEVNKPSEMDKIITKAKKAGRKSVLMLISRRGQSSFIPFNIE